MITPSLRPLAVPVASLALLPGNPRRGDVDAVAGSLARFGQRKPIVVRASDRVIIAGNHTFQAAQRLGWEEIAAVLVDDDDATAQAYALADNRTAELGGYDDELLLELIRSVGVEDPDLLADTGWSEDAIAELVDRIDPGLPDAPPSDEAPEPPDVPFSSVGQVWLLGGHRVMCGDATSDRDFRILMDEGQADCVWTDPPYGVAIVGGNHSLSPAERLKRGGKTIQNDQMEVPELTKFLFATLGNALAVCRPGGAWYVAAPHGPMGIAFSEALTELGVWRHSLVWVKDSLVMGRADYHYRHEPIYYGWTPGGNHDWFGDRKQTTVLEFPRPKRNADHPTMKPIELIAYCLENSAPKGGTVLDPFGGSGSTLMACEYTGRKARILELDQRYVDVICRRWQEHTGSTPILEATGEPHDFTKGTDAEPT